VKVPISTEGGIEPRWRRDGKEIFFMDPSGTLMAADVTGDDASLQVGPAKRLFPVRLGPSRVRGYGGSMMDVSSDGQRFLVAAATDNETVSSSISLIVNWPALLPN
jgi:hypothetical protein